MAAPIVNRVELGFVEETEQKWKFLSHFFPSKVGGKPAWLALKPVPDLDTVKCDCCGKPCVFLLQVYSPEDLSSFHRTIYVFVCSDPSCNKPNDNRNIVALRSQLPHKNHFYSQDPPDESNFSWENEYPKADTYQPLCRVCGCAGPKKCSKCREASYCCREHQIMDWKNGHKTECQQSTASGSTSAASSLWLFPELDLVTEPEPSKAKQKEKSEEDKMKEYKDVLKESEEKGTLLCDNSAEKDLGSMAMGEEKVDSQFFIFKERISRDPEQILRYQREGEPLWVATEGTIEEKDVPKCSCGGSRKMEFQVMPQLLNHLHVDSLGESLDWGTLVVYTCMESCDSDKGYIREFIWKQDFSKDNLPQIS